MNSSATDRREPRARLHVASLAKALAALLLVGGSAASLAGTNGISVSIASLITPDAPPPLGVKSVTYSLPGSTFYAPFAVTISNPSNANIQNAWLKFSTSTSIPGLSAPFDPAQLPAKCAIDPYVAPANTGLVCNFSQRDLGPPGTSFTLQLPIPQGNSQASLSLLTTLQAGQGNGDANPSQVVWQDVQTLVMRPGSATDIRTWVPKDMSLLVVAPPADAITGGTSSKVRPPKGATVGLKQDVSSSSCIALYKKCFVSTVSILDSNGNPLTFNPPTLYIDLFRPGSTINNFDEDEASEGHETAADGDAHIGDATFFYQDGPNGTPVQIVQCINGPAWEIPSNQDRCVVPSFPANALTFEDSNGWHFRIIARKNGIINW